MSDSMHILVGIDFSDSSLVALQHAVKLAIRNKAQLHLAHVAKGEGIVAKTDLGLNIPDDFPEAKESRIKMQRFVLELGNLVDATIHVRLGEPVDNLLALAREIKPDFLVVGTHGRGPIQRAILGSVSHQLVQRSPVPVLVVPLPNGPESVETPDPNAPSQSSLPSVGQAVTNDKVGGVGAGTFSGIGGVGSEP